MKRNSREYFALGCFVVVNNKSIQEIMVFHPSCQQWACRLECLNRTQCLQANCVGISQIELSIAIDKDRIDPIVIPISGNPHIADIADVEAHIGYACGIAVSQEELSAGGNKMKLNIQLNEAIQIVLTWDFPGDE